MLRRKLRTVIGVLLCLSLLALPLESVAQADLSANYTTPDGSFSFNYPSTWVLDAQLLGGFGVVVTSNQTLMNLMGGESTPDFQPGMALVVIIPSIASAPDLPAGVTADLPPIDIVTLFGQDLVAGLSSEEAVYDPPTTLTINDHPAARLNARGFEDQIEMVMLAVDMGSTTTLLLSVAGLNQMQALEPTIMGIAGSMRSSGGVQPAVPPPQPQTTLPTGGMITYGQTVNGSSTSPTGDRWSFDGSAGDVVTIRMTAGFDNYLELYDAANTLITGDDDSGGSLNALINQFTLSQSGRYTIVARGYAGSFGAYTLTLERLTVRAPGMIQYGETVSANLGKPVGDRWSFTANAGDMIGLSMVSEFDNYLELYDAGGNLLVSDDDSGGSGDAHISYTLPAAGQYMIVARAYSDGTGPYTLALALERLMERGMLAYGDVVTASLTQSPGDRWSFIGQAGESVSIALLTSFDAYLELYDAAGNLLTSSDLGRGYTDALIDGFVLPVSGEYRIVARGYFGEIGEYTLVVGHKREVTLPQ